MIGAFSPGALYPGGGPQGASGSGDATAIVTGLALVLTVGTVRATGEQLYVYNWGWTAPFEPRSVLAMAVVTGIAMRIAVGIVHASGDAHATVEGQAVQAGSGRIRASGDAQATCSGMAIHITPDVLAAQGRRNLTWEQIVALCDAA